MITELQSNSAFTSSGQTIKNVYIVAKLKYPRVQLHAYRNDMTRPQRKEFTHAADLGWCGRLFHPLPVWLMLKRRFKWLKMPGILVTQRRSAWHTQRTGMDRNVQDMMIWDSAVLSLLGKPTCSPSWWHEPVAFWHWVKLVPVQIVCRTASGETEISSFREGKPLSTFCGKSGRRQAHASPCKPCGSAMWALIFRRRFHVLQLFCPALVGDLLLVLLDATVWRGGAARRRSTASSRSYSHSKEIALEFAFSMSSKMQQQAGICRKAVFHTCTSSSLRHTLCIHICIDTCWGTCKLYLDISYLYRCIYMYWYLYLYVYVYVYVHACVFVYVFVDVYYVSMYIICMYNMCIYIYTYVFIITIIIFTITSMYLYV